MRRCFRSKTQVWRRTEISDIPSVPLVIISDSLYQTLVSTLGPFLLGHLPESAKTKKEHQRTNTRKGCRNSPVETGAKLTSDKSVDTLVPWRVHLKVCQIGFFRLASSVGKEKERNVGKEKEKDRERERQTDRERERERETKKVLVLCSKNCVRKKL